MNKERQQVCNFDVFEFACVPAVSDDRSGIRRVAGFDPAEEVEEGGWVFWHTVIWPGCELELTHLSPFTAASLMKETSRNWLYNH